MKKILVLFLAIVVIGAGLGFGATSTSNPSDPGNITNFGLNDGNSSNNFEQNGGNTGNFGVNDGNSDLEEQDQDNWYDGFWNDESNRHNGFWKGGDKGDGKFWKKGIIHDKDNGDQIIVVETEVNNYITTEATGGDAEAAGGNSESNVEMKFASGKKCEKIAEEIQEVAGESVFIEQIPMQKTGLPTVPVLLSTLLICSGLLYKKLRK